METLITNATRRRIGFMATNVNFRGLVG